MRARRALVCLALCFVDVHVRAADRVFDASDRRATFSLAPHTRVVLAKGGLAAAEGRGLRLMDGRALVLGQLTLLTPFGRVACEGGCEAIFTRTNDQLTIEALTEGWTLPRTGEDTPCAIPNATAVIVSGVTRDGRAATVAPTAMPWVALVDRWAKLYPDGPEKFLERVRAFRPNFEAAVSTVAARDHGRAVAMIEAHAAQEAALDAHRRAAAAEDARLRQLFREKNYVE